MSGWAILGGIGVGKAGPGGVVSGFDGSGGVEVVDEGANAREVVGVECSRSHRVSGNEVRWMGVRIVFGEEREAP